jgi:hypothetical protein
MGMGLPVKEAIAMLDWLGPLIELSVTVPGTVSSAQLKPQGGRR